MQRFFASLALVAVACSTDPAPDADLTAFEALPQSEAAQVYEGLSADAQLGLWAASLERAMGTASPEERVFIDRVLSDLDASVADPDRFEAEALAVMDAFRVEELFHTLGPLRSGDLNAVHAGERATADTELGGGEARLDGGPPALCNNRSSWSCGSYTDRWGFCHEEVCNDDCSTSVSGCGWFWQQSCDTNHVFTHACD